MCCCSRENYYDDGSCSSVERCMEMIREYDWASKRNEIAAAIAGALFFTGWWILFDLVAQNPSADNFKGIYYLCGFTGTLSMFMVNSISAKNLEGGHFQGGILTSPLATVIWLFVGFGIGFASLIAAGWILFAGYVIPKAPDQWYGFAIFLQNLLIFLSSNVYKFGRVEDQWI